MAKKELEAAAPPVAVMEQENSGFEDFLDQHKWKLLIGLLAIALGAVAVLTMKHLKQSTFEKQAAAFTSAKTSENYKQVIADYPGTIAAGNAQLMIGKLQKKDKKFAEATVSLEAFVSTYKDHPLRDQGLYQLAGIALADAKPEACTAYCQQLITEHPESAFGPMALIYQGDLAYAAGEKDVARGHYESILPKFPGTVYEGLVTDRLQQVDLDAPAIVEFIPEPEPDTRPITAPLLPGVTPDNLFETETPAETGDGAETASPAPAEAE